jgi:predicted nucleic acid-binding protein
MAGWWKKMNSPKRLVLDANILLRAVMGIRVRHLLEAYEDLAVFYTPDACFDDARRYIPSLAAQRGFDPAPALAVLDQIGRIVESVDKSLYEEFEEPARSRIAMRDVDDWPIVATALMFDAPIWTEDQDFFGTGIATWTSDRIELYLRDA